ncbi:MAG TPA: hypothetical protein VL171_15580 [Verrucomicrobiae bacterium]|nr:hypothetical protein [Verrucomicrobiae bacterium]
MTVIFYPVASQNAGPDPSLGAGDGGGVGDGEGEDGGESFGLGTSSVGLAGAAPSPEVTALRPPLPERLLPAPALQEEGIVLQFSYQFNPGDLQNLVVWFLGNDGHGHGLSVRGTWERPPNWQGQTATIEARAPVLPGDWTVDARASRAYVPLFKRLRVQVRDNNRQVNFVARPIVLLKHSH